MADRPGGFAAGFLRFFLKLFLASIALVFAVCLLVVGLIAVLLSLLKALLTWQKPAPWVVFRRVQKYSARGQWPSYGNRDGNREPDRRTEHGTDRETDRHRGGIVKNNISGFPTRNRQPAKNADVVDVEVREVPPADNKA